MRAFFLTAFVSVLVVALEVMGRRHPSAGDWGVHHYGYLPAAWLAAGAVGGAALFALAWLRPPRPEARSSGPGDPRRLAVLSGVVVVAGAALFWLGRERAYFMGDGALWIQGVARGRLLWQNEPLALYAQYGLNRLAGSPDPAVTFAAVSVAAGVIYLLLALVFAREAARGAWGRILVFGVLALAGLTRLFYGYVETYPLFAAFVILYLVLAVRYLRGKESLWLPVVAASVAPAVHVTAALLLPSLVYLLWAGPEGREEGRGRRLLALLIPAAVLVAGLLVLGRDPRALAATYERYLDKLLPLAPGGNVRIPYGLLSGAHLRDFLQSELLLGPFGALFALLLWALRDHGPLGRPGRFLLVAGLPWWVFSFLYNREIGAARDWDVFAVASIPFLMLTGWMLARVSWADERPRAAAAMAGLLLGVGFFHTLPWVGVDRDEDRALTHFAALYAPGTAASPFARSYAFEEIGTWYLSRKQTDSAVAALTEAADADSTNTRVAGNLAAVLIAENRPEAAVPVLERAVRIDPRREFLRYQLGNANRRLLHLSDASESYREAIRLNPDFLQAYIALGDLERRRAEFASAETVLVAAMTRFPRDADVRSNLGRLYQDERDTTAAVASYRQALERNPDDVNSAYNLGLLLMAGEPQAAVPYFELVVNRNPRDAEAWVNLGVSREGAGAGEAAETAYRQAMGMEPRRPEPYFNLARMRMAAGDTAGAATVLRKYTQVDSISGIAKMAFRVLQEMGTAGR